MWSGSKKAQPNTARAGVAQHYRGEDEGQYRSGTCHCALAVMEIVSGAEKIRERSRVGI